MDKKIIIIIDRIKKLKNIKNDTEVAKLLGMRQSNFAERKRRDSLPYEELINFCDKEGISYDWLITGKEPIYRAEKEEPIMQIGEDIAPYRPEKERIGNILLKNGSVNEKELQKALEEQGALGRDPELDEIIGLLKYDLPELKKYVLKILKARKEFKEGLAGIQEKFLKEGGES